VSDIYHLKVPGDERDRLIIGWMWLAVLSLALAGLFSLLLVLSRTPVIGEVFPWLDFFQSALVVHVNLSVLVWSLSFLAVVWSFSAGREIMPVGWLSLACASVGTVLIAVAPFTDGAEPLLSNYIPVLQTPVFFAGLLVFAAGILLTVGRVLIAVPALSLTLSSDNVIRIGLLLTAITVLLAVAAFGMSWSGLPSRLAPVAYFEMLFWGGGHVLQFAYTLGLFLCWFWLASRCRMALPVNARVVLLFLLLGFAPVLMFPWYYLSYEVTSVQFIRGLTDLMAYGGALSIVPVMAALFVGMIYLQPQKDEARVYHACLVTSFTLFSIGGIIGFAIRGSDVTIPAHYHGSTIGITLAFMGVCYDILIRLGYKSVSYKWARIQLWTYASGQLMHILGLVWSGGYGVQRKVAGAEQALDSMERVAGMGLMGLGGLVSAVGGLIFIIICVRALTRDRVTTDSSISGGEA
jgi:hypothetical protein|tara:strand:- start:3740 stop:5128 length:1389 start_codon:yes stop_codon:yes gene_type:complete